MQLLPFMKTDMSENVRDIFEKHRFVFFNVYFALFSMCFFYTIELVDPSPQWMIDCYYVGKLHPLDSLPTTFQLSGPLFSYKKFYRAVVRDMVLYSKQYVLKSKIKKLIHSDL